MKKFAIIAMALMVALAVTACSNNTQNNSSSAPEQSSSQVEQYQLGGEQLGRGIQLGGRGFRRSG